MVVCTFLPLTREIFHAGCWREDTRFFAPMAHTSIGAVFIQDFVHFLLSGSVKLGRISQFFYKVVNFYARHT